MSTAREAHAHDVESDREAAPLVVSLLAWTTAAVATGVTVGLVAAAAVEDPSDPWSGIGMLLAGVTFGGLAGIAALVVGTIVAVRRHVRVGRRAASAGAFLGCCAVFALTGPVALVAAVPAAVLAAGLARRPVRWWPWMLVPPAFLVSVPIVQEIESRQREDRIAAAVPLAAIDGASLRLDGFELASVSHVGGSAPAVRLRWERRDPEFGSVTLELTEEVRPPCEEGSDETGPDCDRAGRRDDGSDIWIERHRYRPTVYWVTRPDGTWSVETTTDERDRPPVDPVELLDRLQPVDRSTFDEAADEAQD